MRVELKGRGRAWEQGYRWDATKVLQRANRTMELVMKKSLSIGMKPESKRFNCDNGFELPDCWIAMSKKLRGGANMHTTHAHPNAQGARLSTCSCLGLQRAYKLRGSFTLALRTGASSQNISKFLCYQVVSRRTLSNFP